MMTKRSSESVHIPKNKVCSKCKETKPSTEFYLVFDGRRDQFRLRSSCVVCERLRFKKRNRRTEKNRVVNRRGDAKYRKTERGKLTKRLHAHKPESRACRKLYSKTEHGKFIKCVIESRRRARKQNTTINKYTFTDWVSLLLMYEFKCAYCGRELDMTTIDHVIPLACGGEDTKENIVPACRECNVRKNTNFWTPREPKYAL